jgi:aminoglycoside/choline kinase family phosphotransferase
MASIPSNADEITAEWLSAALAESGGAPRVSFVESERFAQGVGILSDLFRLTLTYSPGAGLAPRTLIAKLPSSIPEVRKVAESYGMYQREVLFYRNIAATLSLRTPRCFFAEFDPTTQSFIILLEDLLDARGGDQLTGMTLDEVSLALNTIADLHARWWNRPELKHLEAAIQPSDCAPYAGIDLRYQAAWPIVQPWLASRISHESLRVAERLTTCMDQLASRMATRPRTICHGDFRADNLMFTTEGAELTLVVVDWQIAMQARGTFDVGYLMGGHVPSQLRREYEMKLLSAYHKRLMEGGVADYNFEACLYDYRCAVVGGYSYWVQGAAATDLIHPRAEALFDSWARRLDAATQELGLVEFVA